MSVHERVRQAKGIALSVMDAAHLVSQRLGRARGKDVYIAALSHELERRGRLCHRGNLFTAGKSNRSFLVDLVVENLVLTAVMCESRIPNDTGKRLRSYLANIEGPALGMIINFNADPLIDGILTVTKGED